MKVVFLSEFLEESGTPGLVPSPVKSSFPGHDLRYTEIRCTLLNYPAHFEDVPCQSGVNHIFEG